MKTKLTYVLLILCISSSAQAMMLRLDATAITERTTDFFIDFNDNGDSLLEHGEIVSFSGFFTGVQTSTFWDRVGYVPSIMNISVMSGLDQFSHLSDNWVFVSSDENGTASIFPPDELWSYNITGGKPSPVPIPAAFWLFASALGLLGWIKRRA